MALGKQQLKLKEIRTLGTEIIATWMDDDRQWTNFDFMSSADIAKQS